MKVTFDIPDATAAELINARCGFSGTFTMELQAYQPTIPDPTFVADPEHPESVAKQVPNTETPEQFTQRFFKEAGMWFVVKAVNKEGDELVGQMMKDANDAAQAAREKHVAERIKSIDATVVVSVG